MHRTISTLLIAVLLFSLGSVAGTANAAGAADRMLVSPTTSVIDLDDAHQSIMGYNIRNSNYFKLRDIAYAFSYTPNEFDVKWNSKANAIEIVSGQRYSGDKPEDKTGFWWDKQYATPASANVIVNGKTHAMKAYTINQSTYFQLRDLATILGFKVSYNKDADFINLTSGPPKNAYRAESKTLGNNLMDNSFSRWSETTDQYLFMNTDGTITAIDANQKLYINTYSASFKQIQSKTLDYELPRFAAFYSDSSYNYIVFGQENPAEDKNKEVIRVVKYDKQFKRISSASVKNAYTIQPFRSGNARIAVKDNLLVLHTSRLRYKTEDGLNHQSQLTVLIDTDSMTVKNKLGQFQGNHVSHSFDQFVLFDGSEHVLLDHGDAYPRSIVLHKSNEDMDYLMRDVVDIPGESGANVTGVSIGGFEQSSSSYLVAYNTIDHSKAYNYTSFTVSGVNVDERDIKIAAVPRDNVEDGAIKYTHIATYIGSKKKASIPKLVKISDERFVLLWQEFDTISKNKYSYDQFLPTDVKYVVLDHQGNKLSDIKVQKYFKLADMQPIVYNKNIVWLLKEGYADTFYTIALDTL